MALKVVVYSLLAPLCYYNMFEESNFGDVTWTLDYLCACGLLVWLTPIKGPALSKGL